MGNEGYYWNWRWLGVGLSFPLGTGALYLGACVNAHIKSRYASIAVDLVVISISIHIDGKAGAL